MPPPVTVVETMMLVSVVSAPRKCGPPESPAQLPPSPVCGFCESTSQAGRRARKSDTAYRRAPSTAERDCGYPVAHCGELQPAQHTGRLQLVEKARLRKLGRRDAGGGRVQKHNGNVVSIAAEGVVPVELGIRHENAMIERRRRCNRIDVRVERDPDFVVRDAAVGIAMCRGEEDSRRDQGPGASFVEPRMGRVPIVKECTHVRMPVAVQLA